MSDTPTPNAALQQISETLLAWHQHLERVAVVAAKLGLCIDDGVLFTRLHERAPTGGVIPTGWKLVARDGERLMRTPAFARLEDPKEALALLIQRVDNPTAPRPLLH